jgi:hypothetical protein
MVFFLHTRINAGVINNQHSLNRGKIRTPQSFAPSIALISARKLLHPRNEINIFSKNPSRIVCENYSSLGKGRGDSFLELRKI